MKAPKPAIVVLLPAAVDGVGTTHAIEPIKVDVKRSPDDKEWKPRGTWTPSSEQLTNWVKWSGKPFMITEFYAKGVDSGMPNHSGAG